MIAIILTLLVAIVLGTILSNLLPKNVNAIKGTDTKTTNADLAKNKTDVSKAVSQSNIKEYVALQCGAFSKKEKALVLKNSLMALGTPFIIEENNLFRVFIGIYPKDKIDIATKQLTESKIVFSKINFQLPEKDITSTVTNEMINADLKILNALSEKGANSYETVKLKEWLLTLPDTDAKSVNYSTMIELNKYLTAMPVSLKKEKTEEGYIYIYKFIRKLLKV